MRLKILTFVVPFSLIFTIEGAFTLPVLEHTYKEGESSFDETLFSEEKEDSFSLGELPPLKKELYPDLDVDLAFEDDLEAFFDKELDNPQAEELSADLHLEEPLQKIHEEKELPIEGSSLYSSVSSSEQEKKKGPPPAVAADKALKQKNPSPKSLIPQESSSQRASSLVPMPLQTESLPVEVDEHLVKSESLVDHTAKASAISLPQEEESFLQIDFGQVLSGAPIIYALLSILSTLSLSLWLYTMLTVNRAAFLPKKLIREVRGKLLNYHFDEALELCAKENHFFCKMLASAILARKHGLPTMLEVMKSEGKRSSSSFWQRINLLNDIAVIAPMLGLLGTVLGMFYAFYDVNRSIESISSLFDGLGVSVGTTVAGLLVAIFAMILHATAKYRLVRILVEVEGEAQNFAALIDTRALDHINA